MAMYIPLAQRMLNIAAIKAARLAALVILLFKVPLTADQMTTYATVSGLGTEADFTGYARKTAQALSVPIIDEDGNPALLTGDQVFVASGSGTANMVYGFAVVNTGLTAVEYAEQFPEGPKAIAQAGDAVAFVVPFNLLPQTSAAVPTL